MVWGRGTRQYADGVCGRAHAGDSVLPRCNSCVTGSSRAPVQLPRPSGRLGKRPRCNWWCRPLAWQVRAHTSRCTWLFAVCDAGTRPSPIRYLFWGINNVSSWLFSSGGMAAAQVWCASISLHEGCWGTSAQVSQPWSSITILCMCAHAVLTVLSLCTSAGHCVPPLPTLPIAQLTVLSLCSRSLAVISHSLYSQQYTWTRCCMAWQALRSSGWGWLVCWPVHRIHGQGVSRAPQVHTLLHMQCSNACCV